MLFGQKICFKNFWKAPARFKLMTYRCLVNALTHFALLLGSNFVNIDMSDTTLKKTFFDIDM